MDIDFDSLENEIFSILGNKRIMVLATSYGDSVTARNMRILSLSEII